MFLKMIMLDWLKDVLIVQTNKSLEAEKKRKVSFGEILWYFGLWILMSTVGSGFSMEDLFVSKMYYERTNPYPYNLRKYMQLSCFQEITANLRFTNVQKPAFVDKIWEVRQMISA